MKQLFRLYDHVSGGNLYGEQPRHPLSLVSLDPSEDLPAFFARRESLVREYLSYEKTQEQKAIDRVILATLMKTWAERVIVPYFRSEHDSIGNSLVWCITIESMLLWLCTTTPEGMRITQGIRKEKQTEATIVFRHQARGPFDLVGGNGPLDNITSFLGGRLSKGKKSKGKGKKGKSKHTHKGSRKRRTKN